MNEQRKAQHSKDWKSLTPLSKIKQFLLLIICLIIFIAFLGGGGYLIFEEQGTLLAIGIVLAIIALPLFIIMLKFLMKLDLHGILDVLAGIFGFLIFLAIIALFIFSADVSQIFFYNLWIQVIALIICIMSFIGAYYLANKESFRFGGILMAIAGPLSYFSIIAIILSIGGVF
ncbi:MAG: hypothetical protein ACTSRZ_04550 [Promethearchaeota archaeon]